MKYQWWVILTYVFTFALVFWQEASGKTRVTRSAVESLRIQDSYIIHFKENITEKRLQRFVATLGRKANKTRKFDVEIHQQFLSIKCLTARLSKKAVKWVRKIVINCEQHK